MKVAGYVRQSESHGRRGQENISPLQQREAFRQLCALYGWELVHVEEDIDYSGYRIPYTQRPGLMRLLGLASQGAFEKLLVYRWTRISRRTREFLEIIEAFRSFGVGVKSVMEDGLDTDSPAGKLMLTIQAGFAQYQSEDLAEYIAHAQRLMVEQGRWRGGRLPYGYRNREGTLVPHPQEGAVVQQVFAWFAAGLGTHQIARELTGRGIPSPGGKERWLSPTVRKLLQNPTYRGLFPFQGQTYAGRHPPLITAALWEKVQAGLTARAKAPRRAYPLSGLVCCSHCGLPMVAIRTNNREGRHRYTCPRRRQGRDRCPQPPLDGPSLEALVQDALPQAPPLSPRLLKAEGIALRARGEVVEIRSKAHGQKKIRGYTSGRVIVFSS